MLVRNNTACSHCGKMSATDMYVRTGEYCYSQSFWIVVIECYDCLAIEEYHVHQSVLRGWMRLLVNSGDPIEKWPLSWSEFLSVQQRASLIRSFERVLPRGGIDHRVSDFPAFWRIVRYLRRSVGPIDGSTFEAFSRAWSCL